ncbi:MAG: hypothetical protein LAP86_10505 [Acidobacteriia bacterium]|nr:hypothetical protein [Terriglobia bacterium]
MKTLLSLDITKLQKGEFTDSGPAAWGHFRLSQISLALNATAPGINNYVVVSFDDGERWQPLRMNLPNCSIRDIDVRHGDLVVATHGRSFWVLDDLSPLRQLDAAAAASELALFAPRPAVRLHAGGFQGTPEPKDEPMAENPPLGATIDYFLKTDAPPPLTIEILDAGGDLVRRYSSDDKVQLPDPQRLRTTPDWVAVREAPSAAAGLHSFIWDLHYAAPRELGSPAGGSRGSSGLWAPPGSYTVRVSAAGKSVARPLAVVRDPRLSSSVTDADLVLEFETARGVQAERVRVAAAARQAESLRRQLADLRDGAKGAAAFALDALAKAIDRVAGSPAAGGGEEGFEAAESSPTSLRQLASSLSGLQSAIESADGTPTADALTGLVERRKLVAIGLRQWEEILGTELPRANEALEAAGLALLKTE